MKLVKFKGYDGRAVYVNPANVNRLIIHEDNKGAATGYTIIDMVGDGDDFCFVVRATIDEVAKELSNE